MSNARHQTETRYPRRQDDAIPRVSSRREVAPRPRQLAQPSGDFTVAILAFGVAGELVVPWLVIWLSDTFVFDVPRWLTWLIFAGPLAIGLLAASVYRAVRASRHSPDPVWVRTQQGR